MTAGLLVLGLVDATALRFSFERASAVFRAPVLVGSVVGAGGPPTTGLSRVRGLPRPFLRTSLAGGTPGFPAAPLDPEFQVQLSLLEHLHPVAHAVLAAVFRPSDPHPRGADEARGGGGRWGSPPARMFSRATTSFSACRGNAPCRMADEHATDHQSRVPAGPAAGRAGHASRYGAVARVLLGCASGSENTMLLDALRFNARWAGSVGRTPCYTERDA